MCSIKIISQSILLERIIECGRCPLQITILAAHFTEYGEQILAISDGDLIELFSIFFFVCCTELSRVRSIKRIFILVVRFFVFSL